MNTPDDLRYTSDHEWIRIDGDTARVGITDYAQDALGDVVFVQLPELGAAVDAGATISEVESTKSVSDVYAPLAGVISAVNSDLGDRPELLNSDPYGAGWMFEIRLDDPAAAAASLMSADDYRTLIG